MSGKTRDSHRFPPLFRSRGLVRTADRVGLQSPAELDAQFADHTIAGHRTSCANAESQPLDDLVIVGAVAARIASCVRDTVAARPRRQGCCESCDAPTWTRALDQR